MRTISPYCLSASTEFDLKTEAPVIALIDEYGTHLFEGSVAGEITEERLGGQGFGYDPVFLPAGQTKTFAQLTESEKNSMSHRGRAIQKLASYLCALHEA